MKRWYLFLTLFLAEAQAQSGSVIEEYIRKYQQLAMNEQVRTGIPAAITLAQGLHESGFGNGELALKSNNHFGIKCKPNWQGATTTHNDDALGECFRAYDSVAASYRDHSDFLVTGRRYSFLFNLNVEDYKGWANGLKKAGYATNPKYPQLLIKLVENYNLSEYTIIASQYLAALEYNHLENGRN